ncbi:MAG: adenylate kinase [Candidatus Komeilibacteria bacterium CG11_big_fil_rev_8_21_14_0_20_36_20]|uniref:Adenylate kinase n=1 Tax=Candidatus Komeilibacteria bacterium CG11_big_fil_rev_8_21_14_0_20_36_20 TaxID=1974477 RepID=A0A2H0NFS8_9BACT|nr:MAG: adenylate kinase [Candidatus Komeilibacteria bacterium CG11_big_fil_rev_8_21_14_0_20_36_20]PIR81386.1 MAG: adenylate kinase [Candidatus Komeilibacteria bacterium CG10_big_fil_rev_8_21_14_0_10_36_65]PJC55111.1 MAG: adenylate kinase [Candidatus Komeilibacteria bacterium CG_4_9_14_0_2_um_filter_36_13]
MNRVIILGPQGSGKSTQGKIIADFLGVKILSSGDIIRRSIEGKTDLGKRIGRLVNKGALIPDQDIIELIFGRLDNSEYQQGFLLDGFPRNIRQARILDKHYFIDKVFNIEISDDEAIRRIQGRLICPQGHIFHNDYRQPMKDHQCDICRQPLYHRIDDQEEAVVQRLIIYHQNTSKLLDYYMQQQKLVIFDGHGSIITVNKKILEYLQRNVKQKNIRRN